jgi:hypothetical protein
MAATEMLAARERPANEPRGAIITSHEVTFPYAFPRAGAYRLWVQVRLDGRVQTGVFDMQVAPALNQKP